MNFKDYLDKYHNKPYDDFQSRCWDGFGICGFFKEKSLKNSSMDSNE